MGQLDFNRGLQPLPSQYTGQTENARTKQHDAAWLGSGAAIVRAVNVEGFRGNIAKTSNTVVTNSYGRTTTPHAVVAFAAYTTIFVLDHGSLNN